MNSQLQSSKPPTGRSRPPRKSRCGLLGAAGGRRGSVAVAIYSLSRSMIWPPMIQVIGIIAATNAADGDDPDRADVRHEAREEVEQHDLDPVERVVEDRRDQAQLQQAHDGVLVDA